MIKNKISASIPDWRREEKISGKYEPWKKLLHTIRLYQLYQGKRIIFGIVKYFIIMRHRFWSVVCGADIPLNSNLGGGLIFQHPNGIVIHPKAVIGPNCIIFQQVTIGLGRKPGYPQIGGHVDIGAGAKILGGVTVGDHVKIGANCVVLKNIPDNCTVVGIPARIIKNGEEVL